MKTIRSLLLVGSVLVAPGAFLAAAETAACCAAAPATAPAACCAALPGTAAATASAALPDTSVYQLPATWQDQDGREVKLADFAGTPVVISMVFTHCAYACPRIAADLRQIQASLPADARGKVRFVLASFDTVRDTPERLRTWAAEQHLGEQWTLLHGDADAVRELSVLLDIPFVAQPDGSFGHGNRILLLDAQGVPATVLEGLGAAPAPLVARATALARQP